MKRLLTTIAMLAFICCMAAQLPPKREFRGVWMPTVTGEYTGLSEKEMKSKLIGQLDRMQELCVPKPTHGIAHASSHGAASSPAGKDRTRDGTRQNS